MPIVGYCSGTYQLAVADAFFISLRDLTTYVTLRDGTQITTR